MLACASCQKVHFRFLFRLPSLLTARAKRMGEPNITLFSPFPPPLSVRQRTEKFLQKTRFARWRGLLLTGSLSGAMQTPVCVQ